LTEKASSLPLSPVSLSTSALASPVRRRSVRVIARNLLPTARERSRTLAFVPPSFAPRRLPSRASVRTPSPASPESVG